MELATCSLESHAERYLQVLEQHMLLLNSYNPKSDKNETKFFSQMSSSWSYPFPDVCRGLLKEVGMLDIVKHVATFFQMCCCNQIEDELTFLITYYLFHFQHFVSLIFSAMNKKFHNKI